MHLTIPTYRQFFNKIIQHIETIFLVFVWGVYFLGIHVDWTGSWIRESFLPDYVSPHSALMFPAIFFGNAFWLIPRFFNKKKWHIYLAISLPILPLFELIRSLVFSQILPNKSFTDEFLGVNSVIFGQLSFLTTNAIFWSFIYRFTRDWFLNKTLINQLKAENTELANNKNDETPYNLKSFAVKKGNKNHILKVEEVVLFKAQGDFVVAIDEVGRKHIINMRLKDIYNCLLQDDFFQINRSEIISFNFFDSYKPYIKNRLEIALKNYDSSLYTSNSRTPKFRVWANRN